MTSRHLAARTATAAATTVLLVGLAGCGDGGSTESSSGPDDTTTASPSSPSTSPSEGSSSATPSAPVSPSYDAQRLSFRGLSAQVPASWQVQRTALLDGGGVAALSPEASVTLGSVPNPSTEPGDLDLAAAVRFTLGTPSFRQKPPRVEDVELAGYTMYHLEGPIDDYQLTDAYGVSTQGRLFQIRVDQLKVTPRAQRERLLEQVLASVSLEP